MSAFGRLIDSYEETAEQFQRTRARDLFLQKMVSEEEDASAADVSVALDETDVEETWSSFLEKIEECQQYSALIDKENKASQLRKSYNNINFPERIAEMEDELVKIAEEQRAVDSLIEKRVQRQHQLLQEREEALEMTPELTQCVVDDSMKAESIRLTALLSGLQGLHRFALKSVTHNEATGDLIMQCKIGDCGAMFVLDAARRLCNMTLENSDTMINTADLLSDAQQMTAPQDLRYAIFFVGAAQEAPAALKADILELRKKFIVQADSKNISKFDISFSNGVTVQISAHSCYSFVPNSIQIESIFGVGGWSHSELEVAKVETNKNCTVSIPAAVEYLLQILDSK